MPGAYIIANVSVLDPDVYEDYKRLSSIAIEAYGAEVCVRGGAIEVLEGEWQPERVVLLRFADVDRARAFHASPEYTAARKAREGIATMRMIIAEGV